MNDLFDFLLGLGRWGGALLLFLALCTMGLCAVDYRTTGSFFIAVPAFAIALALPGLLLLVFGNPSDRSLKRWEGLDSPSAKPASGDFLAQLASEPRPFWVCTHCRALTGTGQCLGCGQSSPVLEVRSDDDLRMVLVAME